MKTNEEATEGEDVDGGVLIISSRGLVMGKVQFDLRRRKVRISYTCSKRRTLRCTEEYRCSLMLLSIVLPGLSNFRMYRRVHRFSSVPVIVLATGDRSVSGVLNLRCNTSSCVAGPFGVLRIGTEVGTVVHEATGHGRRPTNDPILIGKGVGVSYRKHHIFVKRHRVGLATGRFSILRLLTVGPGGICDERGLLGLV